MRLVVNNDEDELATILHASRRRARNGDLPNRGVITIADEDILNYESSAPWSPRKLLQGRRGRKRAAVEVIVTMNLPAHHLRVHLN